MNEPQFIETIKVKDGVFYNLALHIARLERTAVSFFGIAPSLIISEEMIPEALKTGLVKCRVTYSRQILSIEFEPYTFRRISSITLIDNNIIDYSYKSIDRKLINDLYSQKRDADDILIVKNGLITDTSYANVVFENLDGLFTPQSYLLKGTKRQDLLERGVIKELEISKKDVFFFSKLYLINAMIDLEDEVSIPISALKL